MIRLVTWVALLLFIQHAAAAQSPTGLWLTQGRDGVIRVATCGDSLCAEIAGVILDHPSDPTPVDYRGVSQCHLKLISDARPISPTRWQGHIVNPRNGKVYGVELWIDARGNLALRGFLGIPLFGQTQTWTRYTGKVPKDCRLQADSFILTQSSPLRLAGER